MDKAVFVDRTPAERTTFREVLQRWHSFAVIATGALRDYGNVILRKGDRA